MGSCIAQLHKVCHWKAAASFRRERTITVQRIVHINDSALLVCTYADASTQVHHDEIKVCIADALLLCISLRHRFLVQRMEDAHFLKSLVSGDSCQIFHFVHNHRIRNEGFLSELSAQTMGDDGTEIGCMLALDALSEIRQHRFIHSVGTALDRLQKSASAYEGIEGFQNFIVLFQNFLDFVFSPLELIDDVLEAVDDGSLVSQREGFHFSVVFEDSDFR